MSDPKIAYVLKRFPRFSETFILNELLAHEAAGADVHVFSLLDPPDEPSHARLADLRANVTMLKRLGKSAQPSEAGSDTDLFSGKTPVEIGALKAKAKKVAEFAVHEGVGHLHAHFGSDAATVALLAARNMGGTFSYTAHARDIYHTYVTPEADARMRRVKLREAAFVATVSDYNARHLATLCPEARVVRLYNGIDLSMFNANDRQSPKRGRLITVGRLVPKKGFDILLEACAILSRQQIDFDVSLVGTGPEENSLRDRVVRLGLEGRVRFEGSMPQQTLVRHMATAEAAVLPCVITESGDRDGLPTVLLESMAMGLPVVTTTVSGGPEIVEDGVTGLLCDPGNPGALAGSLAKVLSDPEGARAMGRAGRARAERLFDLERNAGSLRKLLISMEPAATSEVA